MFGKETKYTVRKFVRFLLTEHMYGGTIQTDVHRTDVRTISIRITNCSFTEEPCFRVQGGFDMRRAMHQRNQITRIYILIFAVSAIVIAACCIGFGFISNASSKTDPDTGRVKRYTSVYIEEGDTLWSIAEQYISEEYDGMDSYIRELKQMNHVSDTIYAGCYLTVSYYAETGD